MDIEVTFTEFIKLKNEAASSKNQLEIKATCDKMKETFDYSLYLSYPLDALSDNYNLTYYSLYKKPNELCHPSHNSNAANKQGTINMI